ncbi:MAG: hypothetical protein MZV70_57360 [Desulfobacterales bacterium]|nr:hypothetical protein [Desulfobacterales bacterium]
MTRTTIWSDEHRGAADHRAPVAAGFPYHRRRLARDGRLVHRWPHLQ